MTRRDVLTNSGPGGAAHPPAGGGRPGDPGEVRIELTAADHEEPTWEVHRPGTPRRRFDRRARAILSAAAVAALLANAGAAWAYWRFTGPDAPPVQPAQSQQIAGEPFRVTLSGSSDPSRVLRPGRTGNLTVTVTNQHSVPIQITAIMPGTGPVLADDAHREAGCVSPRVTVNRERFPVAWEVPRNTVGAFILPGALTMRAGGPAACRGAVFTVPVQAQAVRP